jgi:cystathionine beta-lyase
VTNFFDQPINRLGTDCVKWQYYDADVLPLWVADVDFASPEAVIRALTERAQQGVYGYGVEPPELRPLIVSRLQHLYTWTVNPESIVFLPGVVAGFNLACRALTVPGDGLLVQTPVYPPILAAHTHHSLLHQTAALSADSRGYYSIDFDAFESAITGQTRLFILCNPHNPVGRCFTRSELERLAEICLRHDVWRQARPST